VDPGQAAPDVLNPLEPPSMLVTDPPEHTRLRRLVSRAFKPRALDVLRIRIRGVADGLLRGIQSSAECDLIAQYTSRIPIAVIAEMLAIPQDETRHLRAIGESTTRLVSTSLDFGENRAATSRGRRQQHLADPQKAGMQILLHWPYSANVHCEIDVDDHVFAQVDQFVRPAPPNTDPMNGVLQCGARLNS
jgi:cytochrome P450